MSGAYAIGSAVFLGKCWQAQKLSSKTLFVWLTLVVSGLVGSKWAHVLFEAKGHWLSNGTIAVSAWDLIYDDPGHAFRWSDPGYVLLGGILGALMAASLWSEIREYADLCVPALCTGLGFGRIGCYVTGCCEGVGGIPVQLIESLYAFSLIWIAKDWKQFLGYYGVFRFGIEFLRTDENRGFWALGLSTSQWICLALLTFLVKSSQLRQTRITT
ncbi:MAG: prolipoprotein diacylglyceryl transferase [Myxococcaceae bacterium]|nr:prolipoprotein diacylglyceryl transferase [Myxococcaceae bacterium]MBH2005779.1 prolipoprotein diacylglyceryl transferase [Myxococcaceae bacterium]